MKYLSFGGFALLFATAATAQILTEGVAPPQTGKAQIVVFRSGHAKGGPVSCAVREAGAKLSTLPPHHYTVIALTPGAHHLSVKSEASSAIDVDAKPDKTYYAECTIGGGILVGRPHLHVSNREAFMAELPKLKPVNETVTADE